MKGENEDGVEHGSEGLLGEGIEDEGGCPEIAMSMMRTLSAIDGRKKAAVQVGRASSG